MPAWLLAPIIFVATFIPLIIDLEAHRQENWTIWHSISWVLSAGVAIGFWAYAYTKVNVDSDYFFWLVIGMIVALVINVVGLVYVLDECEVIEL